MHNYLGQSGDRTTGRTNLRRVEQTSMSLQRYPFRRFVLSRTSSRTSSGSVRYRRPNEAHIHRATRCGLDRSRFSYFRWWNIEQRSTWREQRQLWRSNSARSWYTWVPNALEVLPFNDTLASAATSSRLVRRLSSLNNNSPTVSFLRSSICIKFKTTTKTSATSNDNVFLACGVRPRETNYDAELVTSNYTDPQTAAT